MDWRHWSDWIFNGGGGSIARAPKHQMIIKAAMGFAATFLLLGCNLSGNLNRDHEKMCRANGKIVVHDRDKWNEYLVGAEKAYQERQRDFGDKAELAVIEAVPGFDLRFGEQLDKNRIFPARGMVKSDAVILSNGKVVARFVDFIAQYDLFGSSRLTCTGLYPDVYDLESAIYE